MLNLAVALHRFRWDRPRLRAVPPRIRRLQVRLSEAELVALCREAVSRDESLAVYLLPYVPFRAAKQHLPILAFCLPAREPLGDGDLTAEVGTALECWQASQRRGDGREARRWRLLVAAYLRMAGAAEGSLLWHSQSNGLSPADLELACQTVTP